MEAVRSKETALAPEPSLIERARDRGETERDLRLVVSVRARERDPWQRVVRTGAPSAFTFVFPAACIDTRMICCPRASICCSCFFANSSCVSRSSSTRFISKVRVFTCSNTCSCWLSRASFSPLGRNSQGLLFVYIAYVSSLYMRQFRICASRAAPYPVPAGGAS